MPVLSDRITRSRAVSLLANLASVATVAAVTTIAGCAGADDGANEDEATDETANDDETALGATRSAVQIQGAGYQFAVVQDGSRAAKATGALEVPLRRADGSIARLRTSTTIWGFPVYTTVRGTCGVTFISPHYAITATHCVDGRNVPDPANATLIVRQYDASGASLSSLYLATQVTGSYPSYEPYGTPVSSVPGYKATPYSCKVVSRCAAFGVPAYNCDTGGDVAMLYCGDRPSGSDWLPVASTEQPLGPVEMYWFHELLAIFPIDPPAAGAPASDFDRYQHYTALGTSYDPLTNQMANWHYIAARTNALLPLKSIPFSNGVQHRRVNAYGGTDLFGCHGTSGSGVLQRNPSSGQLELLGPASTAGWTAARLCNHPYDLQPGQLGLNYTSNASVQQLQSRYSRTLFLDRNPIVFEPYPPIVYASP